MDRPRPAVLFSRMAERTFAQTDARAFVFGLAGRSVSIIRRGPAYELVWPGLSDPPRHLTVLVPDLRALGVRLAELEHNYRAYDFVTAEAVDYHGSNIPAAQLENAECPAASRL